MKIKFNCTQQLQESDDGDMIQPLNLIDCKPVSYNYILLSDVDQFHLLKTTVE